MSCLLIPMTMFVVQICSAREFTAFCGEELTNAIGLANQSGESCTIYIENDLTLDAPLKITNHRLVGRKTNRSQSPARLGYYYYHLKAYCWEVHGTLRYKLYPSGFGEKTDAKSEVLEQYPCISASEAFSGGALILLSGPASLESLLLGIPDGTTLTAAIMYDELILPQRCVANAVYYSTSMRWITSNRPASDFKNEHLWYTRPPLISSENPDKLRTFYNDSIRYLRQELAFQEEEEGEDARGKCCHDCIQERENMQRELEEIQQRLVALGTSRTKLGSGHSLHSLITVGAAQVGSHDQRGTCYRRNRVSVEFNEPSSGMRSPFVAKPSDTKSHLFFKAISSVDVNFLGGRGTLPPIMDESPLIPRKDASWSQT